MTSKEKQASLATIRDMCTWICYHALAYNNDGESKRLHDIDNELEIIHSELNKLLRYHKQKDA